MPAIRVAAMPQLVVQHFMFGWLDYAKKNGYNYNDIFIIVFVWPDFIPAFKPETYMLDHNGCSCINPDDDGFHGAPCDDEKRTCVFCKPF